MVRGVNRRQCKAGDTQKCADQKDLFQKVGVRLFHSRRDEDQRRVKEEVLGTVCGTLSVNRR